MFHRKLRLPALSGALVAGLLLAACSSSGGGQAEAFELENISVPEGEQNWQINRPIEFRFTRPVDFSTVNPNSIQIRQVQSATPATGTFSLKQQRITTEVNGQVVDETITLENVVVFQPTCPKQASPYADAGFLPGGVQYEIRVVGSETGQGISVRSQDGRALSTGQVRLFRTPASFDEIDVFQDPKQGPPQPVVRGSGLTPVTEDDATYLEIGGEGGERRYFELDPDEGVIGQLLDVPLNLYSQQAARVVAVVVIDQPVDPSPANVSPSRIGLEFQDQDGEWQPVTANVGLVANCTEQGAEIRIEPVGILPPTSDLRVNISPEFRDIRGDFNLLPINTFARFRTRAVGGNMTSDELKEDFELGGAAFDSFEDTESSFALQRASWGGGSLEAAFGFDGTGGPGGDFDFALLPGQDLQFDTVSQNIFNDSLTKQQTVTGGVMQVRDFTLSAGSIFRVAGPNRFVLLATGDVRIDGVLDASGFAANPVQSLLLATVPQPGGLGAAGGGQGGLGSPLTTSSSPRGGPGSGAFGVKGLGGQGGETGYARHDRDYRRPGGGGGGVFGPNEPAGAEPSTTEFENGLVAQPGFDGFDSTLPGFNKNPDDWDQLNGSVGAETGAIPARGGDIGTSPFLDANDGNDFWGVRLVDGSPAIIGELSEPWAGSGGGGGGDAIDGDTFPTPQFQDPDNNNLTTHDNKGGGGGGGGGSIHIMALGSITFGPNGRIVSDGGRGGSGESTNFLDRVGGGGGGGSGGHVILETNTGIDFSLVDLDVNKNPISAKGARGGLGLPINEQGQESSDFAKIYAVMQRRVNEGGTGGPGLVQLHLPGDTSAEQLSNLVLPGMGMATLADLAVPDPLVLVPSFGSQSRAQLEWVALGGASPASGATDENPTFLFGGTDGLSPGGGLDTSMIGFVETDGNDVVQLDPVYTGTLDEVRPDLDQVVVTVTGVGAGPGQISDAVYTANEELLVDFGATLELAGAGVQRSFTVAAAELAGQELTLTLAGDDPLADFAAGDGIELIPRFFRVVTTVDGTPQVDTLPQGQSIQIHFQAASLAEDGGPNEDVLLVDWTGNIEDLNDVGLPLAPAFFRFAVIFDTGSIGGVTPRPSLEFLRMPFEFSGPQ